MTFRIPHTAFLLALGLTLLRTPPRRDVRVCAGGDVSLGTNLDTSWVFRKSRDGAPLVALPDPWPLIAPIAPLVSGAELVLLNVEGAIGAGRRGTPTPERLGAHRRQRGQQSRTRRW